MKPLNALALRAFWALLFLSPLQLSATVLAPGDLQFVAYQADTPDAFSFVLWQEIKAGTQIEFTDSGWLASGEFRGREGLISWQSEHEMAAGSVVNLSLESSEASTGTLTTTSTIRLASSGDQLFAFQGSWDAPAFIAGLQMDSSGWQDDAGSASQSALPDALQSELAQFHFDAEWDNALYQGPTSGLSQQQLQLAITSSENWQLSQSSIEHLSITHFSPITSPSPEGEAITLAESHNLLLWSLGLLILAFVCRSSQKTPLSRQLRNQVWQRESDQMSIFNWSPTLEPYQSKACRHLTIALWP